ncbi:MAG: cupin domain-containing protein [Paracoccaceae bacterium]
MTAPKPLAIHAAKAPARAKPSFYPAPFAARMEGRSKQPLGDLFGLQNFGINRTTLAPGAQSALLHRHSIQDEFIYVLEGDITLVTEEEEILLSPGMCAGFPAAGHAHALHNKSNAPAIYLEIGDRSKGDEASYPQDDLVAKMGADGWEFTHKDGAPYPKG